LFKLGGLTPAGSLTQACRTREEFVALLTALVDTMKGMHIPGDLLPKGSQAKEEHIFTRMKEALEKRCDDRGVSVDDRKPALDAIGVLEAVNDLRNSFQHTGGTAKHVAALQKLGVVYPSASSAETWLAVRARVIDSIRELRRFTASLSD
jgi:hypothetical protein